MTPREIMFAEQPARERKNREQSDALVIAALGANDPKQAFELAKKLT